MPANLESEVRVWAAEVDALPEDEDYLEVTGALVIRDTIQEALDAGEKLSLEYESMLRKADDRLMAHREVLLSKFPEVFVPDRQEAGPRSYWWWFLNEGPQVRDKAESKLRRASWRCRTALSLGRDCLWWK